VKLVESLCRGGKIVEFGCGTGTLPGSLAPGTFSHYHGIDRSKEAIRRARANVQMPYVSFECCQMQDWQPSPASLILAEECLYYLTTEEQRAFLAKCLLAIGSTGAIAVMVHSAKRHRRTVETFKECVPKCEMSPFGHRFLMIGRA